MDEIQAEPPRRFQHSDPDGFPDICIRKPPPWVRLWLVGTVCFLAGIVSHGVLNLYAPIVGRGQMASNACFEGLWFAAGLLLVLIDACMDQNPATRRRKFLGFGLGTFVAFVLVCASLPP
jgi:hypothetical protein